MKKLCSTGSSGSRVRLRQSRAVDGDDAIVVTGNERIVAAVVTLAAGQYAELERRRR